MRPEHLLNYGYTPTCQAALERLAGLLKPTRGGVVRLLDPCCADGQALAYLAHAMANSHAQIETYGVEIEEERAESASLALDHVLCADFRRTVISHKSISFALLNPPYDQTDGEDSLEKTIIRRSLPYLAQEGVAALVIPQRLLPWAGEKLRMRWLALFESQDPASPNQVVLVGEPTAEPHLLPEIGTVQPVDVPAFPEATMTFRVNHLTPQELERLLAATPLPDLYPVSGESERQVLHPLRPGHRAAYLAGHGSTIDLPDGRYLRVAIQRLETRREEEVEDGTTRCITLSIPKMVAYILGRGDLREIPFEQITELAADIDRAISLQSYVEERPDGTPEAQPWEQEVVDRINRLLPPMNGRQGLLPAQAVRAVGMARTLLDGQKTVFGLMEMGYGKAQPLHAKVLTPNGWRVMGEIQIGDQVIGANGMPTRVIGVYPQGEKDIYRVTFTDGASAECCADHLWTVQTPLKKWKDKPSKTLSLREIMAKGLSHANGNLQHFIPITQPVAFPTRAQPLDPYLLGVLLGDGYLANSLTLSSGDAGILRQVRRLLPEGLHLNHKNNYDYSITTGVSRKSSPRPPNTVARALRKMDLLGRTSGNKFIPKAYLYGSIAQRIVLLQGLLDTDGYVQPDTSTIEYTTTSPQLAEDITFLVQSLGGVVKRSAKQPTYSHAGQRRKGKLSYRLFLKLPNEIQPFHLPRKLSSYRPRTKYFPSRAITDIQYVGRMPAQCIKVAAEDGLYLTDNCIATHNTPISLTVRELVKARKRVDLTVVLTPPHLVKKWGREARRLAPVAQIVLPEGNGEERQAQVHRALQAAGRGEEVILILSREAVKLGPLHRAGLVPRLFPRAGAERIWSCPNCGTPAVTKAEEGWEMDEILRFGEWVRVSPDQTPPRRFLGKKCPVCRAPYAASEPKPRRWPLAEPIYRAVRSGRIRNLLLLTDEAHEYRNASLQGTAFSRLFRASRWAILLTGTLFGGRASDLYRLLRWTSPEMRQVRLTEKEFVERYGYAESVEVVDEKRAYGRHIRRSEFRERPGVSPAVYRFLLSRTAFGALRDVAIALPAYTEQQREVATPALGLDHLFVKSYGGRLYHEQGKGALSAWLRAALGYYNIATVAPASGREDHTYDFTSRDEDGQAKEHNVVLTLPVLPERTILPKERELLDLLRQEASEGRKSVILVEQTTARPLPLRLEKILRQAGLRAVYLNTARVPAGEREEWIEKQAHQMDALITHPKAVETGLDLVMFQTVVAYEAIYAVISLAQAVCRIWRLGQTRPVRVFALGYQGIELEAWNVIARKISWAKSVYGDFVPSSLGDAGVDDNLDLLRALTERITGVAKDHEVLHTTTLAGIEAPFTMPEIPAIPVSDVFPPVVVVESWADWAARRGKVVAAQRRRRPGGAVSPDQLELGMG